MQNSDLETIISRIQDNDPEIQKRALQMLHNEIVATQASVGFNHQELYDNINKLADMAETLDKHNRAYLYDMLSVINLFHSDQNVLKYRLMGSVTDIGDWGLQYVRQLVCCILDVINNNLESEDYTILVEPIIRYLFKHNAEIEAIDFILEVSFVPLKNGQSASRNTLFKQDYTHLIVECIDDQNKNRIISYLEEMDSFYDIKSLIISIFASEPCRYLVYLIKKNEISASIDFVKNISHFPLKKQCLHILARNSIYYESDNMEERNILTNSFLDKYVYEVTSSLELLPPQKLNNIFKSLDKEKAESAAIANALIHFSYNRDPIFFPNEGDYKVNEDFVQFLMMHKSISTVASLGLINSYSHQKIFKHSSELIFEKPDIGAILALAIAAQKQYDVDSNIFDLLCLFLPSEDPKQVMAALLGISLLFCSTNSTKAYEAIFPLLSSSNVDICLFDIYVLGSVFTGSGDESLIISCVDIYNDLKKESSFSSLAVLGISLLFLKNPELANSSSFAKLDVYSKILAISLMNVGTGNPSVADDILTESFTGDTDPLLEIIGLFSSCLVGLGDNIFTHLLERIVNSSLLLDSQHLRESYPLSLALLYPSSPKVEVVDALEKSLNSGDSDVNSLIALGIVGAGTKSSRISRIFEFNYNNVYKDPKASSALVIAQGLINLGKGLFTLSPLYYDNKIIANRPLIGLLSTIFLFIDPSLFSDFPFLCYFLTGSISHKFVTGYEGTCKVGKPIDVVGFAGNPNKLSGSVIHSLPVVINTNERVEVDDQVYTPYIEDILIKKE